MKQLLLLGILGTLLGCLLQSVQLQGKQRVKNYSLQNNMLLHILLTI